MATHEVRNQPPPLEGYDAYSQDLALVEGVAREGAGWADGQLRARGERAGSPEAVASGVAANTYPPVLRTHDRFGNRVDQVDYHPGYHQLMAVASATGCTPPPGAPPRPGRAATSPGPLASTCGARSTPAMAAPSR